MSGKSRNRSRVCAKILSFYPDAQHSTCLKMPSNVVKSSVALIFVLCFTRLFSALLTVCFSFCMYFPVSVLSLEGNPNQSPSSDLNLAARLQLEEIESLQNGVRTISVRTKQTDKSVAAVAPAASLSMDNLKEVCSP